MKGKDATRSYFNWALQELQYRIDERCEIGCEELDVIEEFIHEMNEYVCMAKSDATTTAFLSAVEAGEYARDIYIMKGETDESQKRKDKFVGWG